MNGTEERENTLSGKPEQSSSGKKGTSKDKGKLYTDAQIHQIKTSAGAEAGRLRQTAERERDTFKEQLHSATSRLNTLERDIDESRLAEAKDDPDKLTAYRRQQSVIKREQEAEETARDLTRREEQLKSDRVELDKDKGVVSIAYIAAKHGLETEELESLGISDHDTLERVAAKIAVAKPKKPEPEGGEGGGEGKEAEPFEPDPGETVGGAGKLTDEQIAGMTPDQYAEHPTVKKRFK